MDYLLLEIIRNIAMAMGAGASMVMVAQLIGAVRDSVISKDEGHLLNIVSLVHRLGFLMAFATQSVIVSVQIVTYDGMVTAHNQLQLCLLAVVFLALIFQTHGVLALKDALSAQVAAWFGMIILMSLNGVIYIDTKAFILSFAIFAIFATFFIDRAYKFTDTESKKTING